MTSTDANGNLHGDAGRFTNKRQSDAEIALADTPTQPSQFPDIQAAWWHESHWSGNRAYASLTAKQKATVRAMMDELDRHVGESALSRRYDVHEYDNTIAVYGWPKYDLVSYQTWAVRVELTEAGEPLERHVAYFDQWGPVWTEREDTFPAEDDFGGE